MPAARGGALKGEMMDTFALMVHIIGTSRLYRTTLDAAALAVDLSTKRSGNEVHNHLYKVWGDASYRVRGTLAFAGITDTGGMVAYVAAKYCTAA